jgi:trehalose 6-phosphate synthase/trehalose 6-phosphate phosphatase
LLELKDNSAVMHWRGLPKKKAREIEERTRALFEPVARLDGVEMQEFAAGLELRTGRNKGGAVEAILAEKIGAGPVAFLGDDIADEDAFRAVNESRQPHLSVLVRRERRETEAEVWLRPPADLRQFLRRWVEAGATHGRTKTSVSGSD